MRFFLIILLTVLPLYSSPIRLTYSVFFPATHIHTKLAQEWAQEITSRTNGRVIIDIYSGGILSGAAENYECVVQGVSDLGMSCFSYSRGMFPMLECLDLPLGYRNGYQATLIANIFYRAFQPSEISETEVMYLHAHGPGVLATRRHITTIDDLRSLSIRGTGISAMIIRALKGNAIGMGQPDTYEALRKGVVDATLCPIETLKGWRQGEVVNEIVKIPSAGYTTAMFVVMNKRRWETLPLDIQSIIRKVNNEWIIKHGHQWDEADNAGVEFVTGLGKKLVTISSQEDAKASRMLMPLLKECGENLDNRRLSGSKAIAFLQKLINADDDELQRLFVKSFRRSHSSKRQILKYILHSLKGNMVSGLFNLGHLIFISAILFTLAIIGLFTRFGGRFQQFFWRYYQRVISVLATYLLFISGLTLLLMIVLTICDIIGRRLGHPLSGVIDLIQILACVSTTAALPYVTAVKGHIAVEYFFQRFSQRTKIFWDSLSRTAIIIFFSYTSFACFQQGIRLYFKHAVALSLGIPLFWVYYVMGVSFLLVILVVAYNLTHPGRAMMNP